MTDYTELITRLRETESRSKRKLLDEAAATIEAMAADMKRAVDTEDGVCIVCKHYITTAVGGCKRPCKCWLCKRGNLFEWRGVQEEKHE